MQGRWRVIFGMSMQKASLAGDFDLLLERWLMTNSLVGDDMGRSICAFRTAQTRLEPTGGHPSFEAVLPLGMSANICCLQWQEVTHSTFLWTHGSMRQPKRCALDSICAGMPSCLCVKCTSDSVWVCVLLPLQ